MGERLRLMHTEQIAPGITLYCGDSTAMRWDTRWRKFPEDMALIVDPPYGIRYRARKKHGGNREYETGYEGRATEGDNKPFNPKPWIRRFKKFSIFWGANHFCQDLPRHTGHWLVWDKRGPGFHGINSYSDIEMAWCSASGPDRLHLQIWNGIVRQGEPAGQGENRVHPMQKSIDVMKWCIGFAPKTSTIVDPYMGSGTTGVAATLLQRSFIGVEKDRGYFDIACGRIAAAVKQAELNARQMVMFEPMPSKQTRMVL